MYDYIVAHGNGFATMNYVFVAFWIYFLCTLPALIYVTLVRHPETNRLRYFKDTPKTVVVDHGKPGRVSRVSQIAQKSKRLSERISQRLSEVDSNNFSA